MGGMRRTAVVTYNKKLLLLLHHHQPSTQIYPVNEHISKSKSKRHSVKYDEKIAA
jgi:hypothetical protein